MKFGAIWCISLPQNLINNIVILNSIIYKNLLQSSSPWSMNQLLLKRNLKSCKEIFLKNLDRTNVYRVISSICLIVNINASYYKFYVDAHGPCVKRWANNALAWCSIFFRFTSPSAIYSCRTWPGVRSIRLNRTKYPICL